MAVYTYPPTKASVVGGLTVNPGPVEFVFNGSNTQVVEDTVTPSNNIPLPIGLMIKKDDGNFYPVTLDTTNPYAHTPIPVAITDVGGTANVNITAGDLNVSIKHNGADPSSVRIGDGTNLATVNATNELKVTDADTHTKLDTVHTDITSTNTKLDTIHTDLSNINTKQGDKSQYTRITDGTNDASVTASNALKVDASATTQPAALKGTAIPGNTTTVALGANATFTGTWFDLTDYGAVAVGVYADQDSAANGFKYQFSSDGVNVHHEHSYTYLASSNGVGYNINPEFKYFRVVYTNGGVAQASFSLISTAKQTALFPSSYKLTEPITGQTQALFTRGVIVGETTGGGGGYVNVKVAPSGAVQVGGTIAIDQATPGTTNGVVVNSSALPSGAATSANQTTANSSLSSIDTKLTNVATTTLQTTGNNSLSSIDGKLPASLGAKAGSASLSVVPATDATFNSKATGKNIANGPFRNNYASANVTTSAYTTVVASMASAATELEIFDSSGQTMVLAVGGAGSEVDQVFVFPGGNGRIPLSIAAGARVSIKAVSANATTGEFLINFYA